MSSIIKISTRGGGKLLKRSLFTEETKSRLGLLCSKPSSCSSFSERVCCKATRFIFFIYFQPFAVFSTRKLLLVPLSLSFSLSHSLSPTRRCVHTHTLSLSSFLSQLAQILYNNSQAEWEPILYFMSLSGDALFFLHQSTHRHTIYLPPLNVVEPLLKYLLW